MKIPRPIAATLLALALVLPVAAAPALADQAPTAPKQHALDLINQLRADMGRAPLAWDARLADIAQWRSDTQAANMKMEHLSSWEPILSRMDAAGIEYDGYGEVLVWGTVLPPMESAEQAVTVWRNSATHWAWLSSAEFDHLALGMATDTNGRYYWTGLLLNAPEETPPDLTPPVARITATQLGVINDGRQRVTVTWAGENAVAFRLQKRVDSGAWRAVTLWTLATARAFKLPLGHRYAFRVRARDADGNKSAWSEVVLVAP